MRFMKKTALIALGVLNACALAQAKEITSSSGMTLSKPVSVRAEGMGGAQTALITDELAAASINPAGLSCAGYPEISAAYMNGLVDDSSGALYYSAPMSEVLAVGGGLTYYDGGLFEENSDAGESLTVSAQRDYLGTLTGAYRFLPLGIIAGANLKVLHSTLLGQYSAVAAAADLGAQFHLDRLHCGLALKNLGTPLKYRETADSLPSYALLGAAGDVYQSEKFSALVAADLQYDFERAVRGSLGAELELFKTVSLRAGYKIGSDLAAYTLGFGLQLQNFQIEYAFSPMQALNSVHQFSLKYTFAPEAAPKDENTEEAVNAAPDKGPVEKNGLSVQKVPAEILELQKSGGRVVKVILNLGAEQHVKVGFEGVIKSASGKPLAVFVIRQVDPRLSLAEVTGLSQDIDNDATAVINIPVQ